ncbi:1-aminocyclopropane-1-carboxylate deaminase/D-cysteine desulfhydrase [Neptuniibacter halophilus]|uniref:1-aminocyclopropane-1-carboxylate deaminase/D-cysteine desulfhydrase n=1 Tax=Neptuniibacter halophilus TaxID=651666 RepID=UPI0025732B7C|nr:pyridoxal-phosphate dependent enzyme [Neptuniibacter halophilus]
MTASPSLFDACPRVPLQHLQHPVLLQAGVSVALLRLDQTDAVVSGNKWYKLKYNLEWACEQGFRRVLSFGGAYSNHIHALADAGRAMGLETIGMIRGEPAYAANPTLRDAAQWGMQLHFVSRDEYRRRHDRAYIEELAERFPDACIVPEGGSNALAVKGAMEIVTPDLLDSVRPDQIVLACGTGGTLAGVALSCPQVEVLGIPVLKNAGFLRQDIADLMAQVTPQPAGNWRLDLEGHGGGYARTSAELLQFIRETERLCAVPLDQVYTGKMLMRLFQLIGQGVYPRGSRILAVHTGGLQGRRTLPHT